MVALLGLKGRDIRFHRLSAANLLRAINVAHFFRERACSFELLPADDWTLLRLLDAMVVEQVRIQLASSIYEFWAIKQRLPKILGDGRVRLAKYWVHL